MVMLIKEKDFVKEYFIIYWFETAFSNNLIFLYLNLKI